MGSFGPGYFFFSSFFFFLVKSKTHHQNGQQPWTAIGAPLAQLAAGLENFTPVRPALSLNKRKKKTWGRWVRKSEKKMK